MAVRPARCTVTVQHTPSLFLVQDFGLNTIVDRMTLEKVFKETVAVYVEVLGPGRIGWLARQSRAVVEPH